MTTRRLLLGLASVCVTVLSFGATTWLIAHWTAADASAPPAPGLARATPQAVAAPPPAPIAAPVSRATHDSAPGAEADAVGVAAADAERAEEEARMRVVDAVTSADEPLEVRVDLYLTALERELEATGDAAMLAHRGVWLEHFLRIDVVQQQLAELSPGARANALAHVRARMGFDDEQIDRMAERDAWRDERWERGYAYASERDRLAQTFAGARLEEELRFLREQTFGAEAITIEREEASGFHRFERRRIYGRN